MLDGRIRYVLNGARYNVQVDKRLDILIGCKESSADTKHVWRESRSGRGVESSLVTVK